MKIDICKYLILLFIFNEKVRYRKTFKIKQIIRAIKESEWTDVEMFVLQRNINSLLYSISAFQTLTDRLFLSKYLQHQIDFFFFWRVKLYDLILQ